MCVVRCRDFAVKDGNAAILGIFNETKSAFQKLSIEATFPECFGKLKKLKAGATLRTKTIGSLTVNDTRYQVRAKSVKLQREWCWLLILGDALSLANPDKTPGDYSPLIDDQIINGLPGIFYLIDEQGRFRRWNKNFETVTEFSPDEIQQISPLDLFDDSEKSLIQERIEKVFREGTADVEADLRTKSGKKIPYYFNGKTVVHRGQSYLAGMGIDITQRTEALRFGVESEERLRYIFQTEPNCVKILDGEGALLQMNESGLSMIEADKLEQVAGQRVVNLVDEPFQKEFNQLTKAVVKGESGTLQFSITGLKGTKRWLETHAVPLKDMQTGRNLLLGVTRDITEQKGRTDLIEAISEVQQTFISQKNTQQFFDFVVEKMLCITGSEFGFFGEVVNSYYEPTLHTFSNVSRDKQCAPVDFSNLKIILKELMMTKNVVTSTDFQNIVEEPDRQTCRLRTFLGLPIFRGTEMVGVICLANNPGGYASDLAEQLAPLTGTLGNIIEAIRADRFAKAITEDLQETTRKLYLTYRAAGLGTWLLDFEKGTLTGDDRTVELLGLPSKVVSLEDYWKFLHPGDKRKKIMEDQALLESDSVEYSSEYRVIRPSDGEVRYIKSQGLFFRNEAGKAVTGVSVIYDQTNEKLHEQNLLNSLREKEMLIKEIHHRVKNNLQLISSMLFLKMETWGHSESRDFLTSIREKIKSISLIHERLLQTDSLSTIDIKDYLQKLLHDIQVTYYRQNLLLSIRTDIEELFFSTDYAMYLGQLVNELVVNAIMHAFEGRPTGEIQVSLNADGNTFILEVNDNGVGLPSEADPISAKSYGMQLVQIFVMQLKGTLSIAREKGTRFKIEFSL